MGCVEQLCRRHDELACDGFGATRGWAGVSAVAHSALQPMAFKKSFVVCELQSTCNMSCSAVAKSH
jgi:hypothetical protein